MNNIMGINKVITTDELKSTIIQNLNLEDITLSEIEDDMELFGDNGLGLDSVDAIELTLILEKEYGVKIKDMANAKAIFTSAKSLTQYINEQKQ